MERRKFFTAFCLSVAASIASAAEAWFYWPGREGYRGVPFPKPTKSGTEALRRHLATDKKHNFGWDAVRGKSREELIVMHDDSHFGRGDNAPMKKTVKDPPVEEMGPIIEPPIPGGKPWRMNTKPRATSTNTNRRRTNVNFNKIKRR